jgi:hypothetical protein
MTHGSSLRCKGIIGDGCGGDREFFIENEALFAYDPTTKTSILLASDIKNAINISKKGCDIFIQTKTKKLIFNLSKMEFV